MLRSFYVPLCLLASFTAQTQTITVVDASTRDPVEAATLYHKASGSSAITDAKGQTLFAPFARADSIHFQMIGYQPQTLSAAQVIDRNYRVAMWQQPFSLGEFEVSAHRWEQDTERVPDQVTVIRQRDVAFANPGTAADLLESTGEVFLQRSQLGGGSPMLRGFAANRVLIVVDGVRMNNAIYRSGNLQNVIGVDANALERAEVLHGPGAMTYGSDAIGGVIDFHLLRPRFATDSNVLILGGALARYASAAGERTGHVHVGLGGSRLAFLASASISDFGDLRTGSRGPEDYLRPWYVATVNGRDSTIENTDARKQVGSGYTNAMALAKLAWRPGKNWELDLNGYLSTTSDIPRYDRLIEQRADGTPRSAQWYYGPQNWCMASVTVRHSSTARAYDRLRVVLAYQDYAESRNDRNYRSTSLRSQAEHVQGLWANVDLEKRLTERSHLLYGAEGVSNLVGSNGKRQDLGTGTVQVINSRYPDGSTWYSAAAYVGLVHDVTDRLTLTAGARYSVAGLDCTFDTTLFPYPLSTARLRNGALTGNFGLTFRPAEGWKFSADLSTGFRAPNIDDIGKVFDSEPGALVVPNADLVPELAYSAEWSVERTIRDRARLRLGAYGVLLDRAMVRRPYTLNGSDSILFDGEPSRVEALVNAAQATVFGLFIAADVRVGRDLMLELRYNWQRGTEQDDVNTEAVPLRHAPPPFGHAGINWQRGAWRLQAMVRFSGGFTYEQLPPTEQAKTPIYARDAQGRPHAPGWYAMDLRGRYQVTRALELSAGVENLTDQRYRPYSSGISSPGLNGVVAMRVAW